MPRNRHQIAARPNPTSMSERDTRDNFERRIRAALDCWRARKNQARFWWRDDDAARDGASLRRLLGTLAGAPLALAVIPEPAQADLAAAAALQPGVTVFQHGWAHINHAPRGQASGAWELDGFRPRAQILAEMQAGKARLESLFGERFAPVMVPPWNRIHAGLLPGLAAQGFVGVSAMSAEPLSEPFPGVRRIDCRFDVLRWKNGARFAGWSRAADALDTVLRDPAGDGIVGINTHHLVTDRDGWRFIECLQRLVADHPSADWVQPERLFSQR